MMIRGLLLIIVMMNFLNAAFAGPKPKKKKMIWQSLEEVNRNFDSVKKPVLIDVFTSWCHYCRLMDATTYRNDSLVAYVNKYYYRYKLDAETKDSLLWRGKQYKYNQRYNLNDFAVYLANGTIAFPTTVIITPDGQPYNQYGLLKTPELELLSKYFVEADYKRITLEEFSKTHVSTWK